MFLLDGKNTEAGEGFPSPDSLNAPHQRTDELPMELPMFKFQATAPCAVTARY